MLRQDTQARFGWVLSSEPRRQLKGILLLSVAIILSIPTLFYLYWLVSNALKPTPQINTYPPVLIPRSLTLEHLVDFWKQGNILRLTANSLFISTSTTLIGLFFSLTGAYALVRLNRQTSLGMLILATRMLPGLLALIGWYRLFIIIGLLDTYTAIILTHLIYAVPLMTWILIGYFEDLNPEIGDAALIDGCSRLQVFLRIQVPLVTPGITVASILVFVVAWNDFIRGLIFAGPDKRPLVMAVLKTIQLNQISWGEMMASAFFVLVPIIVVTIVLQKHIVTGLTAGAVKS